ncbi:MAG: hypothetical protein GKR93_03975 [Gammaproteobacteria bacterium]|nr:hypothetical protein [Gammaproteobacteria bacterium]
MTSEDPGKLNKLVLPAIIVIFTAPMLISWWLLTQTDYSRDASEVSHGELFVPARPLPDTKLLDILDPEQHSNLHGKWSLVVIHRSECDRPCFDSLYKIRQIRLATGKYSKRIQRVLVSHGDFYTRIESKLLEQFKGQLYLDLERQPATFIENFKADKNTGLQGEGELFLIDPLGNLMMYYPADTQPSGIIKDLKRLLRYSRIG